MDRSVRTVEDVLEMLDGLVTPEGGAAGWWDGFYRDRSRNVPFFVAKPDENLVSYLDRGLLPGTGADPGRALDLGCGPGRNAVYLAGLGFEVHAVDLSPEALGWARERARAAGVDVRFHRADVLSLTAEQLGGTFDLIYDHGCFHHLAPHRRISYPALLDRLLRPGGCFGLTCFAPGGGSDLPDAEFYRERSLRGGLSYPPEALREIFRGLEEVELRPMREEEPDSPRYGKDFLGTALFRRAG
jgi:SAM-dependent methyltransferase